VFSTAFRVPLQVQPHRYFPLESFKECAEDFDCAKNVLNSFGQTLKLALDKSYIFTIDIEKIARISRELKNIS